MEKLSGIPITCKVATKPLRLIKGDALLQGCAGRGQLSQPKQGESQRPVGLQKERGVLYVLREAEELLPQFTGPLQLRPDEIKPPQSQQHQKELRGFPYLPTQLERPGVGMA